MTSAVRRRGAAEMEIVQNEGSNGVRCKFRGVMQSRAKSDDDGGHHHVFSTIVVLG